MSRTPRWALVAVVGVMLAAPGAAQAATKRVWMGLPPSAQKSFEDTGSDVNAFFPSTVRIHRGDVVSFAPAGFHDVDIPPAGGAPLPLLTANGTVTGATDAAGAPFWFNGQPAFSFNPRLLKSNFGTTKVARRTTRLLSGLPTGESTKPFRVRFPRPGLYRFFCDIHPGMRGSVRVVGAGAPVPSARADARRVRTQVAAALTVAKGLKAATKPPANTISVGAEGRGNVHYFGFLPDTLTVPVGTTVRFTSPVGSSEIHTATTGPGPATDPTSYLGKIAATFEGVAPSPLGLYPSDQPPTPAALTPTLHGNGFWNSGALDSVASSPAPPLNAVTFSAAGTYTFYCLIHPFMKATITAQ